jgi:ABC-type bacteriocin/lantibiotic exporter with double-glycine peptidase domain
VNASTQRRGYSAPLCSRAFRFVAVRLQLALTSRDRELPARMNIVWRVFSYLRRYPLLGSATLACAIVSTLMIVVFPAVTKLVIDEVLYQSRAERLTPLVLIAALALLLQHGLNSLRIILNNTFEQKVIYDLRSDLYSHIQMLPLRWFDNRATGDLMTRILEDVNSVERMLIDGVEQGVVADPAGGDRPRHDVLRQCFTHARRSRAGTLSRGRRALVHADRASPLPRAAPRLLRDELAPAR